MDLVIRLKDQKSFLSVKGPFYELKIFKIKVRYQTLSPWVLAESFLALFARISYLVV